ncbi:DUF1801 domain-containing protein [Acidaminobacter sp. JC074]|uniref:DUF1801 domain-containing protein n=1 Tax=Acidaminobacter sp. JC074 TaxID=2530199 RepID=UPI001F0E503B|nr:DUF1801 domain-containing protein [Acidaminobacter sp. JC074]MCH4887878.1 DUF1801 domain-containing protein [Acidaminobacter sp. JC074]
MKDKFTEWIERIPNERRKENAYRIFNIMKDEIDTPPKVWEDKSIGFGDFHYINKTNEGDMPIIAFVAAKAHITIYFAVQGLDPYTDLLDKIGSYRRGKICLYISNMDKINEDVFRKLIHLYFKEAMAIKVKNNR